MEQIPTAKEVMAKEAMRSVKLLNDVRLNLKPDEVLAAMIQFAQLHVTAALKATYDKVMKEGMPPSREQILDAYPLTNIK